MSINVNLGATGEKSKFGTVEGAFNRSVTCRLPDTLTEADFEVIKADCRILLELLERNPTSVNEILGFAAKGEFDKARQAAQRNQFTEASFQAKGGGIWLAIAIGVAILLYSQKAH